MIYGLLSRRAFRFLRFDLSKFLRFSLRVNTHGSAGSV